MSLQPIPGFEHFTTQHCVTGSLRHIYAFNDYPISEEMLLGMGAGVGFIYWHMRGSLPFLGGRANVERPGEEGLERTAGRRTGVEVDIWRSGSAAKAEKVLVEQLLAGQPVMLLLDMGFLPYFDFGGEEYHFGYHSVVACGYDPDTRRVLIADRDQELHPVSLADLAKARGSSFKPFPPRHASFSFDFSRSRPYQSEEARQAIQQATRAMTQPPIANLGVKGIYKAARHISRWPQELDEQTLRAACFNASNLIDARGGTGGGLFRYMYSRFLDEISASDGSFHLQEIAACMGQAGDAWQNVAALLEEAAAAEDIAAKLIQVSAQLFEIACLEEATWKDLGRATQDSAGGS